MGKVDDSDEEDVRSYLRAMIVSSILLVIAILIAYFFLCISSSTYYTSKLIDNPVPPGEKHESERAFNPREPSPSQRDEDINQKEVKITIHQEEVLTDLYKSEQIEEVVVDEEETQSIYLNGPVLDSIKGTIQGPSGKETYYNLDMTGVISSMRNMGYNSEDYPYWIRGDGAKMFGNYIMIAADLNTRPKGTILETSLGLGIVCDTGGFAKTNTMQIDIATNW